MMIALTQAGRLKAVRFVFAIFAGSFAGGALASEPTYGVNIGMGTTDNVLRTPTNPQSAQIAAAGLDFSASQLSPRVDADVVTDLTYLDYLHTDLASDVVGTLVARGKFTIVPDRVEWLVDDNFGQTALNQVNAISPENQENVNYFSTGPRLTVGLGSVNRVLLEGNYAKVIYQHSPLDNQRYAGSASVVHELSSSSDVSFKVIAERISYEDDASNPPTDQQEGILRYEARGSRTKFGLDTGYAHATFNLQTYSTPVFQLTASRIVSPFSSVDLALGRSFSNSGDLFRQLQEYRNTAQQTQAIQPTSELFTSTYATLNWRVDHNRTSLDFSVSKYKQSYEQQSQYDQSRASIYAYFSRYMSAVVQLYASTTLGKNRYDATLDDSTDKSFAVGATRRMGRLLSLALEYDWYDRSGAPGVSVSNVNEVWLRLFYGTAKPGGAIPVVR